MSWFTLESVTATIGRMAVDGSITKTVTKTIRAEQGWSFDDHLRCCRPVESQPSRPHPPTDASRPRVSRLSRRRRQAAEGCRLSRRRAVGPVGFRRISRAHVEANLEPITRRTTQFEVRRRTDAVGTSLIAPRRSGSSEQSWPSSTTSGSKGAAISVLEVLAAAEIASPPTPPRPQGGDTRPESQTHRGGITRRRRTPSTGLDP